MRFLRTTLPFLSALSLVALGSPPLQAAERMTAGEWQFDMTTSTGSHSSKQCVGKEAADGVNGSVASAREYAAKTAAKGNCTIGTFEVKGNTIMYTMACGKLSIKSEATYHGTSSEAVLTTTTGGKSSKTEVKARRLGPCP